MKAALADVVQDLIDDADGASLVFLTDNELEPPGGRLITVDPCFHSEQSALQRFVVSNDRGMHVRPFDRYVELASAVFPRPKTTFQRGHWPFPHSICILQAVQLSGE